MAVNQEARLCIPRLGLAEIAVGSRIPVGYLSWFQEGLEWRQEVEEDWGLCHL